MKAELEKAQEPAASQSKDKDKQMVPISGEEIRRNLEELLELTVAFSDTEVTDKEYRKFVSSMLAVRRILDKYSK